MTSFFPHNLTPLFNKLPFNAGEKLQLYFPFAPVD